MRQTSYRLRVGVCQKCFLKGNVPLTNAQMSKLRPRREDLRALSVKRTSLANKRKIIQKGGFLSTLLAPALSVLAGLLLTIMQQARKLVLADEFDREYKRLQRSADAIVKTDRSLQLSDTLRQPSPDDDRKV